MNIKKIDHVLNSLPQLERMESNFFGVSGRGYFENPTSDLMALFMGGAHDSPAWFAKAVLECLSDVEELGQIDWSSIKSEREVSIYDPDSESYKRLDIIVRGNNFVLGIENKVHAGANKNPFHIYDKLINNESLPGIAQYRCVLRPFTKANDVPEHWPVLSYLQVCDRALINFGASTILGGINKWHFFYLEFVNHLKQLSLQNGDLKLTEKSMNFVEKNYANINRAIQLREEFIIGCHSMGQAAISAALSKFSLECEIKLQRHNWPDNVVALRFFPSNWNGSQIVLAIAETENGDAACFFIRAYVEVESEDEFVRLESSINKITDEKEMSWHDVEHQDGSHCWTEVVNKKKLLCFGAYPAEGGIPGSIKALVDLALWLQNNKFTTSGSLKGA